MPSDSMVPFRLHHPLLHLFFLLLFHAPTALHAVSIVCSEDYGHPTLPDCRAAAARMPYSSRGVMFAPPGSAAGAITCPFSIASGTCTIRIQCTHRTQVSWGLMLTLATVLIDGDGGARPGCVNHFGKGGVAALGAGGDPLWLEIAQTGVQGPGSAGGSAPLLKGVTDWQLAEAGLAPPEPVLRYGTGGGAGGGAKPGAGAGAGSSS